MLLPRDILSGTYKKPNVYLCEPDKSKICQLETTNMHGAFKFHAYSELNFNVARVYNDIITGETKVNPFYDKVEAVRLIYLEGFGYFELQDPEIEGDGIKEVKSLAANSLEYTLSQKYLETFYVNTGEVDSVEVMYAAERNSTSITPVTFYNPSTPGLSLLHLVLEKAYGWKIGHVDTALHKLSRQFKVERESIYDFIMNELCEQFNCYAIFDTVNNTINFYAEALTNKFYGDGATTTFTLSPIFMDIGSVSVDGYRTINYTYNASTGKLTLGVTPKNGQIVEVTDGALGDWETDVYVTFDNLAQQMNVSYSADDIKTVLTIKGANDLDIREVNNGLPYLVDLSYFYNVDWMGQDLYDAYTKYLAKNESYKEEYKSNAQNVLKYSNMIAYETNRLSSQYAKATYVNATTVGTYYVRGGDASAGYYYSEVSLPGDYVAGTTYYSTKIEDLNNANISIINEEKVRALYEALKTYYHTGSVSGFDAALESNFSFMKTNTIASLKSALSSSSVTSNGKDTLVIEFFNEMWSQLGLTPLQTLYYEPYKKIQTTNISAGWAQNGHDSYGLYYPVVLLLESLMDAIAKRKSTIQNLTSSLERYSKANAAIGEALLIINNFSGDQLVRLSAFLREDEYIDDNFALTGTESTDRIFQLKQELCECGRIELSKLCEPCLKFSASLANIYALPEFAPIVDQFQLGNLVKVALRSDYLKHARLMQVDLNFEDFSDFSCEFGDLSAVKSQTDLHADLLSQAVSAGKTVAGSASYWDKGSDKANSIDIRLQQGLLNAATEIKAIDGTQASFIDKYGLHLQEKDPVTGAISPKQGWIVNNKFLYSDDAFRTTKSVFGEYTIDGESYWGLLAEAVIAGYIEGSTIKGGTIQIGERDDGGYNFEVDEDGYITMTGGKGVSSNGDTVDLDDYNTAVEISATHTVLSSSTTSITLTCKVYSYGVDVTDQYDTSAFHWARSTGNSSEDNTWNSNHYNIAYGNTFKVTTSDVSDVAFFQCQVTLQSGNISSSNSIAITCDDSQVRVFTSKPSNYRIGDLWVVGSDYQPHVYRIIDGVGSFLYENGSRVAHSQNTILVSVANNTSYTDRNWVESVYYSKTFTDLEARTAELEHHVVIDEDGLHLIGQDTKATGTWFEALLDSQELGFYAKHSGQSDEKIVWLGTKDMNAKNVNVLNYLSVQADPNIGSNPYITLGTYKLQIESNGSLSIV